MGADSKRRPVILAVDDDFAVRMSFCEILRYDYEVLEAADGQTALDIVRAQPVDVILLDIRMPGLDGLAVLKRLKEDGCRARIILVTGYGDISSAVDAMRLGAFDYVTKPFDIDKFLALVKRAATPPRTAVLLIGGSLGLRGSLAVIAAAYGNASVTTALCPVARAPAAAGDGRVVVDLANGVDVAAVLGRIAPHKRPLRRTALRVVDHVAEHYRKATVEHVALSLGLTPDHLTDVFRSETTITVKQYLRRVRVELVKYLEVETVDKLAAIAERVGFHDAAHLWRAFHKLTGHSPGHFRRVGILENQDPDG